MPAFDSVPSCPVDSNFEAPSWYSLFCYTGSKKTNSRMELGGGEEVARLDLACPVLEGEGAFAAGRTQASATL